MIFYTLQGPTFEMEIYEDKIRLVKKPWTKIFFRRRETEIFPIIELSQFQITVPKLLFFSGKIQWTTFSGETATFRFSTNPMMVKKIETYLQKRVIKNHQQRQKELEEATLLKPLRKKLKGKKAVA